MQTTYHIGKRSGGTLCGMYQILIGRIRSLGKREGGGGSTSVPPGAPSWWGGLVREGGGALTINQVQVFKFPSDSQVLSFSSKPAEIAVVIDVSIASIAAGSFFCWCLRSCLSLLLVVQPHQRWLQGLVSTSGFRTTDYLPAPIQNCLK